MPVLETGGYSRNVRSTIPDFIRELEQLGASGEPYASMVQATMEDSVDIAMDEIAVRAPIAGGELSQGFRTRITGQPLRRGYRGDVYNITDYVAAVELGADPHMPPVQSIAWYVRLKGMAGPVIRRARSHGVKIRFRRAGSSGRYLAGVSDEEWQIAWAIARHIEKHGTKGAHMFRNGLRAARAEIRAQWQLLIENVLRVMATRSEGAGL